jgi:hypothetical protein
LICRKSTDQTVSDCLRRFNPFSIVLVKIIISWYVSGMITAAQCRAARALLDWSQQQLADAARIGVVTVRQFEAAAAQPRNATIDVVRRALEAAGVIFVDENGEGPGVRLRKSRTAAGTIAAEDLSASNDG